jgi:hypothetical protein
MVAQGFHAMLSGIAPDGNPGMRVGDKVRFIQVALLGGFAPALVFGFFAWITGRVPLWWALLLGLVCGAIAIWAGWTFFGITHLERLAAHAVHGGRHYYFEHEEIRVVFDDYEEAWIRLADVRRCVGGDASGIRHFHPREAARVDGGGRHVYLSVVGVRRYLKTLRHPDKQRFSVWFERDFVTPFERRRERNLPLHSTGSGRV